MKPDGKIPFLSATQIFEVFSSVLIIKKKNKVSVKNNLHKNLFNF